MSTWTLWILCLVGMVAFAALGFILNSSTVTLRFIKILSFTLAFALFMSACAIKREYAHYVWGGSAVLAVLVPFIFMIYDYIIQDRTIKGGGETE